MWFSITELGILSSVFQTSYFPEHNPFNATCLCKSALISLSSPWCIACMHSVRKQIAYLDWPEYWCNTACHLWNSCGSFQWLIAVKFFYFQKQPCQSTKKERLCAGETITLKGGLECSWCWGVVFLGNGDWVFKYISLPCVLEVKTGFLMTLDPPHHRFKIHLGDTFCALIWEKF